MAALIAAGALAAGEGDVGARIADAAAAEQSLRGPLEGAWTLRDAKGHALFALQIVDPVDGRIGGAWRELGAAGGMGVIDSGSRGGGVVQLKLGAGADERAWLILRPEGHGRWRGRMIVGGRSTPVTLARG